MKLISKLALGIFLFIILTGIAVAVEEHNLTSFQNCSEYTFYVDVSGFGAIYEGAYELAGCELFSVTPTNHRWKCDCIHELNLTLKTLYALDNTYTISVLSVSKGVDYDSIMDYEKKELPVKTFVIENSPTQNQSPTGAVIGTNIKIGVLFFLVLVLVLLVLFFIHYLGGAPWVEKNTRAINLHKRGQRAFESSKLKKAKRYYQRASKLRK